MLFLPTTRFSCGARVVCGRLEGTPSMMALGSTLGTTIDGHHKGAGITKMQGEISRVQYYYEDQSCETQSPVWKNWYPALSNKGIICRHVYYIDYNRFKYARF